MVWGVDGVLRRILSDEGNPPQLRRPANDSQNINPASDSRAGELRFNASVLQFRLTSSPAAVQPQAQAVDREKVEWFFDRLVSADSFATAISPDFPQLNAAEKTELVAVVLRSDRAEHLTTFFHLASPPNVTYDAQRQLAQGIGQAYQQGKITDADLRRLAERLGPEYAAHFANTLAQSPENLRAGGAVEAFGRQARAVGHARAAALAFSSSEELIRRNLTTLSDRRAAFAEVRAFLDDTDRVTDFRYGTSPYMQSQYVQALANAARLHSYSGVSTNAEIDAIFEKAGPRYVQEAVARSSSVPGDDAHNSALNVLGDSSRRIAARGGDEQRDWYVNAAMAYTQSPELIRTNLTTAEQRLNAFDLLNHELAGARGAAREAAEAGYSLLRAPAAAAGMGELLAAYPEEIVGAKLDDIGNFRGQADLANFFQSTIFSPYTSAETRARVQSAVESYVARSVAAADNDSQIVGNRVGSLLGVLEVAAQKSITDASKPSERTFVDQVSRDFAKKLLSTSAGALLKPTGPVGALVGGFVLDKIIDEIFKDRRPSASQLGDAYVRQLEAANQNINLGEDLRNQYVNLLTRVVTELNRLRDTARGADHRNIVDASLQTQQLMEGIRDTSGEVVRSYQLDGNGLNRALDNWGDYQPRYF